MVEWDLRQFRQAGKALLCLTLTQSWPRVPVCGLSNLSLMMATWFRRLLPGSSGVAFK